jgi:hypothetical protein
VQKMVRSSQPPVENAALNGVKIAESPPFAVLASFQIERAGQLVRIVDDDGSAYEGQVLDVAFAGNQAEAIKAAPPVAANTGVPAGSANALQQRSAASNLLAPRNGYVDVQANFGELPPNTAASGLAQNQAPSSGAQAFSASVGTDQAVTASGGFAFQVSGLSRKLNQNVTIVGSCIAVPPQIYALAAGNLSNAAQAPAGPGGNVNLQTPAARPPASQSQNTVDNNSANYANTQNAQALQYSQAFQNGVALQNSQAPQNMVAAGQLWRVTGLVQIGATNRFDLDAAAVQP